MAPQRRIIRIEMLPSQRRFFESPWPVKGFSGPVGSGKTYALCHQVIQSAAANPGCTGLLGAPTHDMLSLAALPILIELLNRYEIAHDYRRSQNVVFIKRSRSSILLASLDRPERLRGTNLAWVGVDELTYTKKESWERLEARLRDPKARKCCMFAVWTPNGFDWVYRRFISQDRKDDHQAIIAAPGENSVVLSQRPDYYEKLKNSYDDLFYRQEVLGEYLNTKTGRVYNAWSEANLDAGLRFLPAQGLCWGLDFNVDPMAGIIGQFVNGRIHVLKELFLRNSSTQEMCERFEQAAQPFADAYFNENGAPLPVTLYGDASGEARSTSSRTDYDLIRIFFRSKPKFRLDLDIPRSNPPVRDRVNSVNAILKNAAGQVRALVHPECRELIADFEEVVWKLGAASFDLDKTADKTRTHLSDAFGYMVCRLAPISGFKRVMTPN